MKIYMFIVAIAFGIAVLGASALQVNETGKTEGKNSDKKSDKTTGAYLGEIIAKIDKESTQEGNSVSFTVKDRDVILVFDENADRMRILTPIAQVGGVPEEVYKRMLQANYDAVLDPRYAIANDVIWAVFIHPLSSLSEEEFVSGIVQTVTAAETFGTSYSSGAFVFGGGDSNTLHEELLKEIEEAMSKADKGI